MAYLVLLSYLYDFIVVVSVSPFKSCIKIVVWFFKGLLCTFFSVHACVILGDICYQGLVTLPKRMNDVKIVLKFGCAYLLVENLDHLRDQK